MTNYNERLDDVLSAIYLAGIENGLGRRITDAEEIMHRKKAFINGNHASVEAKQLITSLIKELVAEAKPARAIISDDEMGIDRARKSAANYAIDQFEQNLLKALEKVK